VLILTVYTCIVLKLSLCNRRYKYMVFNKW